MSKLSNSLKALINAPKARPNTVPASRKIQSVYQKIQQTARSNNVSRTSWLALSVSAILLHLPLSHIIKSTLQIELERDSDRSIPYLDSRHDDHELTRVPYHSL
jgi:hypothetical protein